MLEFLIDNIYIKVGKEIFRQQVGIPMGTDCAPFLANLGHPYDCGVESIYILVSLTRVCVAYVVKETRHSGGRNQ